jgi:conjugative transposon TraN protein
VDLGSADLLAAKADGTENVLRVKAALRDFSRESNLAVITEDGAYYSFNVKYADEPVKLSIEMTDFIHDGEATNRPNNAMEVYMRELGSESPLLVKLIMQSIYKNNDREIKHLGSKRFGIQHTLKGVYSHNGLLYFHLQLKNSSNVPFDVDYITFKIVDKKVAKRTAIQEQVIWPLRAHNNVTLIGGKTNERTVFTLPKFTIPDDKYLIIELHEKEGGRHQTFTVENADLVRAKVINELKTK